MEAERARPRAVPKSWETKKPPDGAPKTPSQPAHTARMVDLKNPTADLELETDDAGGHGHRTRQRLSIGSRSAQPASPVPSGRGRRFPIGLVLLFVAAVVASASIFLYRDQIFGLIHNANEEKPKAKLTSVYRIVSDPTGASVYLDGEAKDGTTPLEIELIPDIEYEVAVKLQHYATKQATVKASVGTEVRAINFKLVPAATLKITSDPPGAQVALDGHALKVVTPATLDDVASDQELRIVVELKGKPPMMKTISIPPGKHGKLHFPLSPN
jgi:hypothetical protein